MSAAEVAAKAASGVNRAWGGVKSAVIPASAAVIPTVIAAGEAIRGLAGSFVRFEIIRDFYQVISLFFDGLSQRLPDSFHVVWGRLTEIVSFCFSCVVTDWYNDNIITIAIAIYVVESIIALIVSGIFLYRYRVYDPSDQQQGLEVKKLSMQGSWAMGFSRYGALALTTLYLPVARDGFQVISCDLKFVAINDTCFQGTHAFCKYPSEYFFVLSDCLLDRSDVRCDVGLS